MRTWANSEATRPRRWRLSPSQAGWEPDANATRHAETASSPDPKATRPVRCDPVSAESGHRRFAPGCGRLRCWPGPADGEAAGTSRDVFATDAMPSDQV